MVSPLFPDRTLAQVIYEIARRCGVIQGQGTCTAGTTTTATDANRFRVPVAEANSVTGRFWYAYGGTSVGTFREVSTYGTIGVFTWIEAATAPDTTTTWILCSVDIQAILDTIADVTRDYTHEQAQPYISESLVTGNLLGHYGDMEEWESGASSAPDGWTLSGAGAAVARSTTMGHGIYSAALTPGAGAVGVLTHTVPFEVIRNLTGSVTLEGLVAANAASDGVVRVIVINGGTGGTTTNTDRTSTYTGNRFEELRDISSSVISLGDNLTSLQVALRGVAAASVMQFDDIMLLSSGVRDYFLPANIIGLERKIEIESAFRSRKFDDAAFYRQTWDIYRDDPAVTTRRRIHFTGNLPVGRHMRIRAYIAPTVVTAHTSNVDPNPQMLIPLAGMRLLEGLPGTAENEVRYARFERELADLRKNRPHILDTTVGKDIVWIDGR